MTDNCNILCENHKLIEYVNSVALDDRDNKETQEKLKKYISENEENGLLLMNKIKSERRIYKNYKI